MATTRGCFGKVFAAATATGTPAQVGEVKEWSFEETVEVLDASAIGDCTKKFDAGAKQTTGNITVWWDPADIPQGNFVVGNTIALVFYPGGNAVGKTFYSGNALITTRPRNGGVDGIVESAFNFQVNGAMTSGLVT